MIAKPLVWERVHSAFIMFISVPNCYLAQERGDGKYSANFRGYGDSLFSAFSEHDSIEAAQAACERHHQVAYVRGLSADAREGLRYMAAYLISKARLRWLAIIDEADAADRAEQSTGGMTRYIKLNNEGAPVESDHLQVLDTTTRLIWTARHLNVDEAGNPHAECEALATACRIGDATDWRLPTVAELFTIADHPRHAPAIDVDVFPGTANDWYWTSTPSASDPAEFAWFVNFYLGGADCDSRGYCGFVRAVRQATADDLAKAGAA